MFNSFYVLAHQKIFWELTTFRRVHNVVKFILKLTWYFQEPMISWFRKTFIYITFLNLWKRRSAEIVYISLSNDSNATWPHCGLQGYSTQFQNCFSFNNVKHYTSLCKCILLIQLFMYNEFTILCKSVRKKIIKDLFRNVEYSSLTV